MKIKVNEIKNVYVNSYSPLVVTVTHTDNSSEQSNISQLNIYYTESAQERIMQVVRNAK
jgi:hypothetical protein